ncbi:MAG: Gfo/Idh/MocA family oxidoreductase [Clostridia bacterium]|nr:Gfo/Idh/MocA family oxidoreductase [Clostridia bacterium]
MKICFIGSCGHTYRTFEEMKLCNEAEFVGIAPGSEHENTEDFKKYNIKVYNSYIKMLEIEAPDIAVISPVFGYTGKIIKECAKRKIDIFSEKLIASNPKELNEVKDCITANNIHFSAMHFLRFTPSFYQAKKAIENGTIGEIKLITAQKSYKYGKRPEWYNDRNLYPGTIPWVGIHAIDWIYFFTKKDFKSVTALDFGNPAKYALCQFELEDEIIASVNIDFLRHINAPSHGDDRIRIAGTDGVIEVFEDKYVLINKDGIKECFQGESPKLALDFLYNKEELTKEEIFMLTEIALKTQLSADRKERIYL